MSKSKSNFTGKHWWTIFFCMITMFFYTGTSVDGMNITVSAFAELKQWDYANLLGVATISGFMSVFGQFFFGWLCSRKGAKFTTLLCLALGGLSYIFYAHAWSITAYVIGLTLVTVFAGSYGYIGVGAFMANWFPRKNGLAMGYASMGCNFSSAFFVPLISGLVTAVGLVKGMTMVGVAVCVLAVIGIITLRETPEECGLTPDNLPAEEIAKYASETRDEEKGKAPFTTLELLRTKEFYLITIIIGSYFITTVGIMSQLVPRNISVGFDQNVAIAAMSVCAIIGAAGSYCWGVLELKLGTKKAMIAYSLWYAVGIFCNVTEIIPLVYVSIFMIGVSIGGASNFTASLTTNVFGRYGFKKAFGIIFPLVTLLQQCNFIVNAFALKLTGSLRGAYCVYIGILLLSVVLIVLIKTGRYNTDRVEA